MLNIRDEVSKIVDIRIPPNGYLRYLREIDRTNNLGKRQMMEMIIALCQSVEELQAIVTDLQPQAPKIPRESIEIEETEHPLWVCNVCNRTSTTKAGALSHARSHEKDVKPTEPTK